MDNINSIDISKRCGIRPENTIYDFIEEITDKDCQELMKKAIKWEEEDYPLSVGSKKEYDPYLKTKIKDLPKEIIKSLYGYLYIDGEKVYKYHPCCM